MKIAFIHPDLGIGGAERLVIDAAVGLQDQGHKVVVYTSYRDKAHCFDEARDGTLEVRVRGDTIVPRSILGRFSILCAILRQIHLAITLLRDADEYDSIFLDQLSVAIPLLRYYREKIRILFYCHFPDKLLSMRTSTIKKIYRIPFDFVEGWTTGQADSIVVNSQFTANIFHEAFPMIDFSPKVIYPCIDVKQKFSKAAVTTDRQIVLSINRFEYKKNLDLAIEAYAKLSSNASFAKTVLIIAGGYDSRVHENSACHRSLAEKCDMLGLVHTTLQAPFDLPLKLESKINVYFLLSIPEQLKNSLLASSTVLVYTPAGEHFGIVPLEAGVAGLPVIAQDNGGPLETVDDSVTGYLRPNDVELWSRALSSLLFDQSTYERREMSMEAQKRVKERFSKETMVRALQEEMEDMQKRPIKSVNTGMLIFVAICIVLSWKLVVQPTVRPIFAGFYQQFLEVPLRPLNLFLSNLFRYLTAIISWLLSRGGM